MRIIYVVGPGVVTVIRSFRGFLVCMQLEVLHIATNVVS
jgi:hypothetical protein